MALVLDNIRKPLRIFAKQSDSQCYIKSIRNLGDAWRRLSDKPLAECDKNEIFVETNFGLNIQFTPGKVEISVAGLTESTESMASQESPVPTEPGMAIQDTPLPTKFTEAQEPTTSVETGMAMQESTQQSTKEPSSVTELEKAMQEPSMPTTVTKVQLPSIYTASTVITTRPRRYRIHYDWGTEHLWRDYDDLEPEDDGVTHVEAEDLLESDSFSSSMMELYLIWADTYNNSFKTRLADTGNYNRSLFATAQEDVAWYVAGYFLAWRIAMAPEVDWIEYCAGNKKWLLQKDEGLETKFTKEFFEIMCNFLKNGPDC